MDEGHLPNREWPIFLHEKTTIPFKIVVSEKILKYIPFMRPNSSKNSTSGPTSAFSFPKHFRIVVGNHAIQEALKAHPQWIKEAWLRNDWERSEDLRELEMSLRPFKVKIKSVAPGQLEKISSSHQGAALMLSEKPRLSWENLKSKEKSIVVALDGIEDPHNLGAIVRTSWLCGVDGVLASEHRSVGLTPVAHKVASGGLEHVPVEIVPNLAPSFEQLKNDGYWVFGLSHKSNKSLFELKIPEKIVCVIGSEDKGLRSTTEKICDELVCIPQVDAAASYNASVAAAMFLTEILRQHRSLGMTKKPT